MKLISGRSPWPSADSDSQIAEPLAGDSSCDVLVIGAGVVGAFVADSLAARGIETVVVDRRDSAAGSTQASTSLLQYDLDVPLFKLVERIPQGHAARALHLGVEAIDDLEAATQGLDVGFERRRSLYVASSPDAAPELKSRIRSPQRDWVEGALGERRRASLRMGSACGSGYRFRNGRRMRSRSD